MSSPSQIITEGFIFTNNELLLSAQWQNSPISILHLHLSLRTSKSLPFSSFSFDLEDVVVFGVGDGVGSGGDGDGGGISPPLCLWCSVLLTPLLAQFFNVFLSFPLHHDAVDDWTASKCSNVQEIKQVVAQEHNIATISEVFMHTSAVMVAG